MMKARHFSYLAVLTGLLVCAKCRESYATVKIDLLMCEQRSEASNIDAAAPRLSWIMSSDVRGARQSAYQVLVASDPALLSADRGDLWDSGRIPSDETLQVKYAGKPLKSRQRCFWKVRIWDQGMWESDWSKIGEWEMGLLSPGDWKAKWIDFGGSRVEQPPSHGIAPLNAGLSPPIFRRDFVVARPIERATIFICGLGQFELHINGEKIGDDVLQPGWTNYSKTDLEVAYDITGKIKPGANAIGVMLGNGMYHSVAGDRYAKFQNSLGPPKLIAQIYLDYADATSDCIATDSSWKASAGPITFSSIYGGEDFDARKEAAGWDQPGFAAAGWSPAEETTGPGGQIRGSGRSAPPVRVARILKSVHVTQPRPGVWIYDLGQNCAMMPSITVHGATGSTVKILPSELLGVDGLATQSSMGDPCYYVYTLKGLGEETWSPRFTYHGCRYLQVTPCAASGGDASQVPQVSNVEGQFITTTSPACGEFSCSNDLFNRTYTLIRWAQRSNLVSLITDCPHRERLGWLEQDYLNGPSLMDNFFLPVLFDKLANDMRDAQRNNGLVPDIAPEYTEFVGGFLDSPEWGSAAVQVPWQTYRWYGDIEILINHYAMMKRYVAYLGSKAKDHLIDYGLGDWYDLGPKAPGAAQLTPVALTATALYFSDLKIMENVAAVLGKPEDAKDFAVLADRVRKSFNAKFYDAQTHQYASGSQTANALPLVLGLAPEAERSAIVQNIVQDIRNRKNGLSSGDIGYRYLLRALAEGGRSDVIFAMNNLSDHPGYGYQLAHGATSLTEAWDARETDSQDHFMLGHIMEWFYGNLAGIQMAPDSVAFNKIIIKPAIVGDLTWVKCRYDSVRGPIVSEWHIENGQISLHVMIPANTTAAIDVPTSHPEGLREAGRLAPMSPGITSVRMEADEAICEVSSGDYHFTADAPRPTNRP